MGSGNENEVSQEATSFPGRVTGTRANALVGREVLFSELLYTVNVWHKPFELIKQRININYLNFSNDRLVNSAAILITSFSQLKYSFKVRSNELTLFYFTLY